MLSAAPAAMPVAASNDLQSASRWSYYLSYHNATQTLAVGNVVYTLFNGNLLAYDADTQSSYEIDKLSCGLVRKGISSIGWSDSQKCMVALYDDNSVDLIYPDKGDGATGRFSVFNIPQIKNYIDDQVTTSRMNVYGDWACIVANKGVIVVNLKDRTIQGYYQIGSDVVDAIVVNGRVYAARSNQVVCGSMTAGNPYNYDDPNQWKPVLTEHVVSGFVGSQAGVYIMEKAGGIYLMQEAADGTPSSTKISGMQVVAGSANGKYVQFISPWHVAVLVDTDYATDKVVLNVTTPNGRTVPSITRTAGGTLYFAEQYDGLNAYNLPAAEKGSTVELPAAASKVGDFGPRHKESYDLKVVDGGLYVSGGLFGTEGCEGFLGYYDGQTWSDMDEDNVIARLKEVHNRAPYYMSMINIDVDPADATHVRAVSYGAGVLDYKDGKIANIYNCSTTNDVLASATSNEATKNGRILVGGGTFDSEGNYWVCNNRSHTLLAVQTRGGDWQPVPCEALDGHKRAEKILFDSRGWAWVSVRLTTSSQTSGLGAFDFGGTINSTSDDRSAFRHTVYNEDNAPCDIREVKTIAEDQNGRIWFGCTTGVYMIDDPDAWFSDNRCYAVQPKVPRNDGTNYADYLLNGANVSAIVVDGGNRKWIGTVGAGIYLVNEDGTEVLGHCTADDSPLISNVVNDMALDSKTGKLYIATEDGLCAYDTGVTEAQPSLHKNNIKAYPNPVRPEYSGDLTITGLTENAEVKVLSSAQQLVARGNSVGGSWQWDLSQQNTGKRVAPGVYYIMVATADGKTSVATKVVVM